MRVKKLIIKINATFLPRLSLNGKTIISMRKSNLILAAFFAGLALLLVPGCEKWFETESAGRLVVTLTDDPFNIDLIESATVTIERIEVRQEGLDDTIPFKTIMEIPVSLDLMDLRNGVTSELANANLPVGNYDQVRLVTGEATLKIKDGGLYALKLPSGDQSGIKVNISPPIAIEGGLTSELLLDIDLSKSFILRGNTSKPDGIMGVNFKPVVRAVNISYAGSIEGKVTDIIQNILKSASVIVVRDSVVATAFTDASGKYRFIGIPAGTYRMMAAKESYDTLVFEGVKVVAGNVTVRNFSLKQD